MFLIAKHRNSSNIKVSHVHIDNVQNFILEKFDIENPQIMHDQ